jgi:ribosomal protein L11 methyltransferase
MKPSLRQIRITTNSMAEDALADRVEGLLGISPSIYTDVDTGRVEVQVFLELTDDQVHSTRSTLREVLKELPEFGLDPSPGIVRIQKVSARNWQESWKRHFRPFLVEDHLWVKPPWSRRRPRKDQKEVILDPGLSFGTGQHPTTRFCLQQIARYRPGNSTVATPKNSQTTGRPALISLLDVGTGSGLLAIAAARLSYEPIAAMDFDPDSVRIAKENAERNGVADRITLSHADILLEKNSTGIQYDLVTANLMADLLIQARDILVGRVKSDGKLVLAGILTNQFDDVIRAYEAIGWRLFCDQIEGEWRSGTLTGPLNSGKIGS